MDIKPSDIKALEERVAKRQYKKYLLEINLKKVRRFSDQKVSFDFPVTAIIGTNGGGKSTILGACALAYEDVKPGDFFPKSNVSDNSMANWRIDYDLIDRSINHTTVSTNARFVSAKWRREKLAKRPIVVVPIQRTVPAGEQTKYKKFIGIYSKADAHIADLNSETKTHAGRILAKDLSKFKVARINKDDKDYIFIGYQSDDDYSQFHFGAGEASVIDMVDRIERSDDFALVLIEELENGLHPVAIEKMVQYLIGVAKRKKIQVVFTTHSEHALKNLPDNAIWACIEGQAYHGRLNISSLRAMTGDVDAEKVIFVEDAFAVDFVEEILRQGSPDTFAAVEVHKAGGYPYVIEVLKHHNSNPTVQTKGFAVIDGDQESGEPGVVALPGGIPEYEVFDFILEHIDAIAAVVQQRCQCPQVPQDKIASVLKSVKIDTTDPHLLFQKIGNELGFLSELVVRRAFISIYVERNPDRVKPIIDMLTAA